MDEIFVLNIGTGWVTKKRNYQEIKSYGAGQWVINILDILMNNTVELTEYQLQKIYEITGLKDNFQSIDFELEDGKDKMDDASDESLQYLLSVADKEIIKNKEKLDWICDVMYNKEV